MSKKVLIIILIFLFYGLAYAHGAYQGKSFTFHRQGHVIDVNLDQGNTLAVVMDTVEIGTRTNFCTPLD